MKRKRFDLYILAHSLTRACVSSDEVAWTRLGILAHNRMEALESCLAEIRQDVLARIEDATILRIAVYAGEIGSVSGRASRLMPLTVERDGNLMRRRGNG